MPTNYPSSLDALANPGPTTRRNDPGFELDIVVSTLNDIAEALEAKLGAGASMPGAGLALVGRSDGSSVWTPAAIGKNRLINGGMALAQRFVPGVAAPTGDNVYGLDRWRNLTEVASTGYTIVQGSADHPLGGSHNYLLMQVGSTTACKTGVFQPIEGRDIWDFKGDVCSLQLKAKVNDPRIGDVRAAICQWTGTEDAVAADPISAWNAEGVLPTLVAPWSFLNTPANLGLTTSYQTFKIENVSIPAPTTNLAVFIWNNDRTQNAGDFVEITDVQLEKGPICTAVERRPLALELVACQRFCEVIYGAVGGVVYTIGTGQALAPTQVNVPWMFKTTKRALVTNVTAAAGAVFNASQAGAFENTSATYSSFQCNGVDNVVLQFAASGLAAGSASFVGMASTGTPYLIAAVEL